MTTWDRTLFASAQTTPEKARLGSFAVSYLVQAVAVSGLLYFTIVAPKISAPAMSHVQLTAPDVTPTQPAPMRPRQESKAQPVPEPAFSEPPKIVAPVLQAQQPQRVRRLTEVPEIAQPQVETPKLDAKILASLPAPKTTNRIIATNTFGSEAAPTLQKTAPSKVQTGGFGDPNGFSSAAHGNPNVVRAGSFDLPQGSGHGNGTGGSSGSRGTVASTGFGNGTAMQNGSGHTGNTARVQTTGFGSVVPATMAPSAPKRATPAGSSPVVIQSKPTPVYTTEARKLGVEGEVLLNVVFAADGKIRILNVVRGLGHGLDEAAERAAQGVRFSPAIRDGHPVDSNATLHIVFQLS